MNNQFQLVRDTDRAVEFYYRGGLLMRYVYRPETLASESPRPFVHPVRTLGGSILTSFRPNDHPWHHGLSFTINQVAEKNFWGGPSYRSDDGYQWRDDHGVQEHVDWLELSAEKSIERLRWRNGKEGGVILEEVRSLKIDVLSRGAWMLGWKASLRNVTQAPLSLGNYHSRNGLIGSHYTGLQFRGTRDLLDEHGDPRIGITTDTGLAGEAAVHGAKAHWMAWDGQKDETLRRVSIRFINNTGPIHWFVRRGNPLAAFPFQFDRDHTLEPGSELTVDHSLIFSDIS